MEDKIEELKELVFNLVNNYAKDHDDSVIISNKISNILTLHTAKAVGFLVIKCNSISSMQV
ncbi:MAG: hypothetical protein ACRCWG_02905 [Sarcina sp.]